MSKSENRWFLIETGEGDVSITPFCEIIVGITELMSATETMIR